LASGVPIETPLDFDLVPDCVSKEVVELGMVNNEENKENDTHTGNLTHVKTGVWQVTCFHADGTPQKPHYIVTAVSMDDRVDTKKLRKAIFTGQTTTHLMRPKLALAPTEIAEELVGFQSGTMAPICHSVDIKLFMEESIVADAGAGHRLNVGSGMQGKCLSISIDKFMEIANLNPEGMLLCSLVRKAKPTPKV